MTDKALQALCERLGYQFEQLELLQEALRHPSFTHENPHVGNHNQRLEFLGDAVVGLAVAEALIKRYPEAREGDLTRWRAALVSEKPMARVARRLGLGDHVMLGKGEDGGGGRSRSSLLCDAFEAVVGAAFLDGGLAAAREVVETVLGKQLDRVCAEQLSDHKSRLQERVQASCAMPPIYEVINATGPDHDRRFEVRILIGERAVCTGFGRSKKAAEQEAAKEALERLEGEDDDHESA